MAGLATAFGSGAMTNSIAEIEGAQVILVSGSNTTEAHPQIARRIYNAVDRGSKLIVIDPRRTPLARLAHIHLRLRPGTDIPLVNGLMRCILDAGLVDSLFVEMRTENYIAMRDTLLQVDMQEVAAITGVDAGLIKRAAKLYGRAQRSVICYCLGVTQHICGTDNVKSYANLALLTGHVEQEFTGVDPLRGQNNVQGACDMGGLPAVFPGYQSVTDAGIREKFEQAWGVKLPGQPGLTLLDMTHGLGQGGLGAKAPDPLQAMVIMGENPMLSDPGIDRVEATLEGLDFLVVSDIFLTETARMADVVFPAASFAEKTGTVTNSERRVQLMHQAIEPIGACWTDVEIIMALSNRMGYQMEYESPAEIMEEICLLTPIYGGMYHDRLDDNWGLQWPCTDRDHPGTPFLHKFTFTRGRGHFAPADHVEPAEKCDSNYPFTLITGRVYHHYHTGTMSRQCHSLNRECDRPMLEMHQKDGDRIKVSEGDEVELNSRRGKCGCFVHFTDRVEPGTLYTNFHFAESPINRLTVTASDPVARCPEYKITAVQVARCKS